MLRQMLLVTISLVTAVLINETFPAGEGAFIMTVSGLLEECTVAKVRAAIEKWIYYASCCMTGESLPINKRGRG